MFAMFAFDIIMLDDSSIDFGSLQFEYRKTNDAFLLTLK